MSRFRRLLALCREYVATNSLDSWERMRQLAMTIGTPVEAADFCERMIARSREKAIKETIKAQKRTHEEI